MDKQEIFNKVATHMAEQGCRSTLSDPEQPTASCAYRGDGGTKCAIGCLIPDNLYTKKLEGVVVTDDRVQSILIEAGVLNSFKDLSLTCLLKYLQDIHDNSFVNEWERDFKELAEHYFLEMPALDWTKCNNFKKLTTPRDGN